MEFLEKRRQFIAKKVASSEFELPEECKGDLNLLPMVCKGNSYGKRCTTKDLSAAGRELFEMILEHSKKEENN